MQRKYMSALAGLLAVAAIAQFVPVLGQAPQMPQQPQVLNYGRPMAPSDDMYYINDPKETWIPDEFISNPDSAIDPTQLKGYHYPPILHKVTVLNRNVRAGESVRFEAMAEDPTEITPWSLTFEGPKGRRTSLRATFLRRKDNPFLFDGTLQVNKWAEPGLYIPYVSIVPNELGHSKAYFQEYHPGLTDVTFTVFPHENVDVTAPVLQEFRVGEKTGAAEEIPSFDIKQPIPLYARVTDDRSGVDKITVRFTNAEGKYTQTTFSPLMGEPDWYVAYITLPEWYIGGEYKLVSMWIEDRAGQTAYMFGTTNPMLKNAKFMLKQDPGKIDKVPPRVITINLDKENAALGSEIRVNVVAVDDKSGIGTLVVDFASIPSYADHKRVHLKTIAAPAIIQKSGFNVDANTWTGTFKAHVMDEPGEWHVTRVMARDNADNLLDMRETEYKTLQSVRVNFTGGVRSTGIGGGMATGAGSASTPGMTPGQNPSGAAAATGAAPKIRRVDMIPPHPPRGACLNCHEP